MQTAGSSPNPYAAGFWAGFRPDPTLTVSEWADSHRILTSTASAEAGRWDTARTPYLRDIMDDLSPSSGVQEIVFMKGSQVGGSECGINWIGSIIAQFPGPTLLVQPTVDLAKDFSKRRIEPLITETEPVRVKIKAIKEKDATNTILQKDFQGGSLRLGGANAAASLRSMPIKNLFLDEIDAYPIDLDGEGDPVKLAKARTRTFARRKIFYNSSPTIAGKSRIEKLYQESDRRKYYVPCPHCEFMQEIRMQNIETDKDEEGKSIPETAYLVCEAKKCRIEERHKTWMLENGKWVAQNPGVRMHGYHISALYSPLGWYSWADAVRDLIAADGDPIETKTFVNTVLGETFTESGDAPDWERIFNTRENYEFNTVPNGGIVITAGVDVQPDRLECEIVAWGKNKESWSVAYHQFMGDTAQDEVWDELEKLMVDGRWLTSQGNVIQIRTMAVDTGFNTHRVYDWIRKVNMICGDRVLAIKGQGSLASAIGRPKLMDINYQGKTVKRGLLLWPVGVDYIKSEVYGRLRQEMRPDGTYPKGYCHFPQYDTEYFKMLTAEEKKPRIIRGGHRVWKWEKTRPRNEALDCRVYATAAAAQQGIDRWGEEEFDYEAEQSLDAPPVVGAEYERRKSNWLRRR